MGDTPAATAIRAHLARVAALRDVAQTSGEAEAVSVIKRLQAARFRYAYADLAASSATRKAVSFFLDELYGEHDFARRDDQFARIAGGLERLFPDAVSQLAVALAEIHALTEELDHTMARLWLQQGRSLSHSQRYVASWRACGARSERLHQLATVQHMGAELQHLTRMRSLRMGLRMMRGPAKAAGLEALQHFLESGFDAFASMNRPQAFLDTVRDRERQWIGWLFDAPLNEVCHKLDSAWQAAGGL